MKNMVYHYMYSTLYELKTLLVLKRSVSRDFRPPFFSHDSNPSRPLINRLKYFRIRFRFRRDLRIFKKLRLSQTPQCASYCGVKLQGASHRGVRLHGVHHTTEFLKHLVS